MNVAALCFQLECGGEALCLMKGLEVVLQLGH